jgi:Zn-dependent protease
VRAHFRIFGVPVRVEPFFVIVAILLGLRINQVWLIIAWVGIVFVSVLVHEMGHAFMFRVAGQRSAVVLHGFGGFTVPTGGGRRVMSKPMSIAVSLAGVVFQLLLLALPAYLLMKSGWGYDQGKGWFGYDIHGGVRLIEGFPGSDSAGKWDVNMWPVLRAVVWANVAWAVLNILPIRPLDGGHVSEELFGLKTACKLSIVAAVLAGIYLFVEWGSLFILIFMGMYAFFNYRDLQAGHNTGTFDVEAPAAPAGNPGQRGSQLTGRRRRSGHLQAVPTPGELAAELMSPRSSAEVETRVWNALRSGDADRAAAILRQAGPNAPKGFVQASVALAQGHSGLAGDMFEAAYLAEPDGPPNLVPASLLAEHGAAVPLAKQLVIAGPAGVQAATSLQTHLHYAERFREAAEVGEQVFAAGPSSPAQIAFEVACSWARADRADEGLRWVEAAVDAGFKAPSILDSEPDLAPVRALPGWPAVRARLTA